MSAFHVGQKVERFLPKPQHELGERRDPAICECGEHAFVSLTRGYVTFTLPEDIWALRRKWSVNVFRSRPAAVRILWPERIPQMLSNLLTRSSPPLVVDHINGDPLDNRLHNLRICTQEQNSWNRRGKRHKASGLPKGVFRKREKFRSSIKASGVNHYLGQFDTVEEAAAAYAAAAEKYHGEFARIK